MEETMPLRLDRCSSVTALLTGVAALALSVPAAHAQGSCQSPGTPQAGGPSASSMEGMTSAPSGADLSAPSLSSQSGVSTGSEMAAISDTGYIDSAIPRTMFRERYDAAYKDNRPDRAEFFYAKCGCFRQNAGALTDPKAPGPPLQETRVDYQDVSSYFEFAASDRLSGFVEVPLRFLNPEVNANATGIGDINVGVKYALIACADRFVTLQFRTYIPTGDAGKGLGTDHVSLEPAVLLYQRLTDQLTLEAELRDWIPIGGTDFAGNVIRYGVGLSYEIYKCDNIRIAPVGELVGWSVLSGKELAAGGVVSAAGDTIVNAKAGVRIGFGEHSDIYLGYGRALTGTVWYKDIVRLEYRLSF